MAVCIVYVITDVWMHKHLLSMYRYFAINKFQIWMLFLLHVEICTTKSEQIICLCVNVAQQCLRETCLLTHPGKSRAGDSTGYYYISI